ncbi:unnamed protein product, partial [Urochloa humidicola]
WTAAEPEPPDSVWCRLSVSSQGAEGPLALLPDDLRQGRRRACGRGHAGILTATAGVVQARMQQYLEIQWCSAFRVWSSSKH